MKPRRADSYGGAVLHTLRTAFATAAPFVCRGEDRLIVIGLSVLLVILSVALAIRGIARLHDELERRPLESTPCVEPSPPSPPQRLR